MNGEGNRVVVCMCVCTRTTAHHSQRQERWIRRSTLRLRQEAAPDGAPRGSPTAHEVHVRRVTRRAAYRLATHRKTAHHSIPVGKMEQLEEREAVRDRVRDPVR
jgi:hypothetical protein